MFLIFHLLLAGYLQPHKGMRFISNVHPQEIHNLL
jgi:hypothetical protein